jgi:hypothetical protein
MSCWNGHGDAAMFHRTFLVHHGLALAMIAAGIVALAMGAVGWLVFSACTILTVASISRAGSTTCLCAIGYRGT